MAHLGPAHMTGVRPRTAGGTDGLETYALGPILGGRRATRGLPRVATGRHRVATVPQDRATPGRVGPHALRARDTPQP